MIVPSELLAQYDREMRQDPVPGPGSRVEHLGPIVRVVGEENCVIFSDLDETNARELVADQVEFFRAAGREFEWKAFGHDRPAGLEAILAAAGLLPDELETLVARDLREGLPRAPVDAVVDVRRVTDGAGVDDAVSAREAAFGREPGRPGERYAELLRDPNQALFVAYAEGRPVASGRVEMPPGRAFAALWGGGTAPAYRHRGVYRCLVAARAALARDRGYRYLTVDARASSRPILERLGFVPLTTTRAWTLRPGIDGAPPPPSEGP
jgi:ribosomal protein S18 acetylase RimI-like enzyme